MQAFIGATLLTSKETQPQSKPFEIYDSRLPGFTLRVQPSGVRSYYARFGRNRRVVLGKVGTLAPEEARERCQKALGNFAHGRHPLHGTGGTDAITLGMFIADTYTTSVKASRPRTAANTLEKLHRLFRTCYPERLTAITVERIESWKARRLNAGRSAATVLRDLAAGVPQADRAGIRWRRRRGPVTARPDPGAVRETVASPLGVGAVQASDAGAR